MTFLFTILQSLSVFVFGTRSSRVTQYFNLLVVGGIDIPPIAMDISVELSHSPSFTSTPAECAVAPAQRRRMANRTTVRRAMFFMIDPLRWFTHDGSPLIAYHIDAGRHPSPPRSALTARDRPCHSMY